MRATARLNCGCAAVLQEVVVGLGEELHGREEGEGDE
jgi:hypothetical protein